MGLTLGTPLRMLCLLSRPRMVQEVGGWGWGWGGRAGSLTTCLASTSPLCRLPQNRW
jgi:hypothetical protein